MAKIFNPFEIFDESWEELEEFEEVVTTPEVVRPNFTPLPIAAIYWAENGGAIRTVINGAKRVPTGFLPVIKAGFRTMPWDSKLESQLMQLADISSRVHFLLAQPHRLEIRVRGNRGRPLVYFPDVMMKVDPSFLNDLLKGMSFADAVKVPTCERLTSREWETLIIEVKADVDSRDGDERYRTKLEFAKEVYRRRGWHFIEIRESAHLKSPFIKTARFLDWRKRVAIGETDLQACREAFDSSGVTTLWRLENELGGGNYGRVKAVGLHYRQRVSIDFRNGLTPGAVVYLMKGEAA